MRILLVEDFKPLRKSIAQALHESGYVVDEAGDGRTAIWSLNGGHTDLVLLDVMLPGIDGFGVLKAIRSMPNAPLILMLTAKDTVDDRVAGLDAGADDYLVKPFALEELLARVRALIRRRYRVDSSIIKLGPLKMDLNARRVYREDNQAEVPLSASEYAIFEYMALRKGHVVSRSDIWDHTHGGNSAPESNVVDVFIGLLRKKIDAAAGIRMIHTRRGLGYVLAEVE
jgi:DNA-binding response OmpR family regulator